MSLKTAYSDFKRGKRRTSRSQVYFRDPTPEQWQKTMDNYYRQQQNQKNARYK
jgi:hypothetical protein